MLTNKNDEECDIRNVYDVNAVTKSLNTSQIIKLIDESICTNQFYNLTNHIKLKIELKQMIVCKEIIK